MRGFSGVVGCIDRSHIRINSYGADFFFLFDICRNFSAICDHKKRFLSFSVGYLEKFSYGGVYRESGMRDTVLKTKYQMIAGVDIIISKEMVGLLLASTS